MRTIGAFATHPGKRSEALKKQNEDYAHAWEKNGIHFQAVADGNGRTDALNPAPFLINEVQRFIDAYSDPQMTAAEIKRMVKGAVHCANRVLLAFKRGGGEKYASDVFASLDMTAITPEGDLITAHTGDSRTYLLRDNRLHQLSKDHTEAQRLCDAGKITKEQIFTHPDRDILFSALGFDNPEIDVRDGRIKKGDIIMLLTDGAHKLINPSQLNEIVISAGNCYDTCTAIIEASNMLGGPDNIAVCVTYIPDS